ncbi:MAG TPA: mycothiol system anti-sigma-R factor [Aeromicrobium sp.]|nr:mycothiol system anti-sigma-R factor [Aeromicrobium sp.]
MDPTKDTESQADGPCGCDCSTARERLYLFLDKEIDSASCEEIEQHIEACSSCLTEYDVERIVKSLVHRSCAERAPETLVQKVQFAIRTVEVQYEA